MRVFITIPSFAIHGGIRIILEWANRLAAGNHEVYLRALRQLPPSGKMWFAIDPRVRIVYNDNFLGRADLLIVTSPHAAHYLDRPGPFRKIIFLQMMEHLFHPDNAVWLKWCTKLYRSPHPLITISLWNWQSLLDDFGRTGPVHYVGNGVNFDDFPILDHSAIHNPYSEHHKTVLVEGWESDNPSKDAAHLGPIVARRLKAAGYRIHAYAAQPPRERFGDVPDMFFVRPKLDTLNHLYSNATILLKATRFDARACAPVEAMAKGVPTVRAIIKGDDDLRHGHNCLKVDYEQNALSLAALRLLEDDTMRAKLSAGCLEHVKRFSWDHWWPIIERILSK